jgi:SAM-dependent methyltransferase
LIESTSKQNTASTMSTDKIYDKYWQSGCHVTKEWSPEFFQKTLGVLAGRRCVLDYGCGLGYSYQGPLTRKVKGYVGADISDAALADARNKGLEVTKIQADGQVELADQSCDGAVCSEVLEHLWDPLAAAKEINRVLEPGGVLVVTVPNFGYLPWRLLALLRAQVPLEPETPQNRYRGVHIRFYSKLMLTRLLRDAGFREIKVYGWCGCSIWHVFWAAGHLAQISNWADRNLPAPLHLPFLERMWPNVVAQRLRVVAVK